MIKKDKSIISLMNLVNNTFGNEVPIVNDYWEMDLCAVGLRKNNRLIYVSTIGCKKGHYFYECEELLDNSDLPYITRESDDDVSEEQLLEVMCKFFGISKKT